jgi:hypothetical protein
MSHPLPFTLPYRDGPPTIRGSLRSHADPAARKDRP